MTPRLPYTPGIPGSVVVVHPRPVLDVEYVLPLRWNAEDDIDGLTQYLVELAGVVDVTVVDGSDSDAFESHAQAWGPIVRHMRPRPWPGRNRKVAGVVTGVFESRHRWVIIADDDVRYTMNELRRVAGLQAPNRVVCPQNYFTPLPWHARWDTARMLLNRAFGMDYPGTFAVDRDLFLRMNGYDGDVLFENLQMLRELQAAGGEITWRPDLHIARQPPTTQKFWEQRVRQAYDDFAQPGRLAREASWLPVLVVLARQRPWWLVWFATTLIAVAELGRRRGNGGRVFPSTSALWAPLWVLERSVCVWLAIRLRMLGGVRYYGDRLFDAAKPVRHRPRLMDG